MTHPGVGPLTALAFVLIIGTWERFPRGKQIGNYVGMIPSEDSSARKQRLGHISKQVIPYCASCWWRRPKRQRVSIPTGDVATFTWRCVGTRALPR
jgi:transposase